MKVEKVVIELNSTTLKHDVELHLSEFDIEIHKDCSVKFTQGKIQITTKEGRRINAEIKKKEYSHNEYLYW